MTCSGYGALPGSPSWTGTCIPSCHDCWWQTVAALLSEITFAFGGAEGALPWGLPPTLSQSVTDNGNA